ncbi:MAG: Asp-tRNA(Asn)/Glu-tRNA(Gln) amidotransferase subunit GatC [Planctomycetota bacterium]|jgi:aspartyl-tRNA(Asn)/glutamyl-tRNA(Gln) amidotransferase subunit C
MSETDAPDAPDDTPPPEVDLTAADVRKIARLARLRLAEDEHAEQAAVEALLGELRSVLGHINRLRSLDLDGVEPMTRPHGSVNRLDADEPGPVLDPATLLAAAPLAEGPFIAVPKVLADDS